MAGHALDPLFRPRSVAVVGASSDPNKIGGRPLGFLRRAGFKGAIYPVNPSAAEVQGLRAFATLADIGSPVDQAIIAVPGSAVLSTLGACVAAGARAIQVFSSGFGEAGEQGARELADTRALVRSSGTRVLGPNSLGIFNTADAFFGTFATALDGAWPRAGHVGVATQSGAFGSYFFAMAQARGLGFSHFVATGNEADVDVADCIDFLAADSATRVIVTALEGCRDGRKLARALEAARTAGKPVLMMKVGVSAAGAQAAATHTGSLTGADRVFDAVVTSCGAWRAPSLEALVDAAYLASAAARPRDPTLLVVTTSGGIGVLCADEAESASLVLAPIPESAAASVRAVAALAAGRNPVDTSAGIIGDTSKYATIAEIALASRSYGAALLFLAHIARNPAHWKQLEAPLFALRERHPGVTFVAVLMADVEVRQRLEAAGFAVFEDPSRAVRAIGAMASVGSATPRAWQPVDPDCRLPSGLATEAETKAALAALGIAFVPERSVRDADAAAQAAAELGYPVVLKILSPDISHKTEVGGVALGIDSEARLRRVAAEMLDRVGSARPEARIDGFLVSRQAPAGVEVLVGAQVDPSFGAVVTVGAGGVLAELLRDTATALAPLDEAAARDLIASTRVAGLLEGWRGAAPCNVDALAAQIARLSRIAAASIDSARGIELNPVIVTPEDACAVDALLDPVGEAP